MYNELAYLRPPAISYKDDGKCKLTIKKSLTCSLGLVLCALPLHSNLIYAPY